MKEISNANCSFFCFFFLIVYQVSFGGVNSTNEVNQVNFIGIEFQTDYINNSEYNV